MILETRALCFAYHRDPVVCDVNLRLEPGITAAIGPNAAGKSTLLQCLCGLLKPTGEVLLDDRPLKDYSRQELVRLVSYLPQSLATRAALTVFEVVLLGRVHWLGWRVSPEESASVEQLLLEMRLDDLAGRHITELSGGQLQMVAIAQALIREPTVLMMDEPTSNLDVEHQFALCELIRSLTLSRGISTVMALHDLNVAARFADSVCVLEEGAVRCYGSPAEVLTAEMIAAVYHVDAQVSSGEDGRPMITPLRRMA